MPKIYNEDSRVKIPALVHFTKLGYDYLSIKEYKKQGNTVDLETNIFMELFHNSLNRINTEQVTIQETKNIVDDLSVKLSNDDLGREFYNILISGYKGLKLIDLSETEDKNTYTVVTELIYKNGDNKFRPDITVLINGLPLAFLEVKKPYNKDGIQAEYYRIERRFGNPMYKKFVNLTQITVFSNNTEYDDTEVVPLEGAFYATGAYGKLFFNHFREEDESISDNLLDTIEDKVNEILVDNNLISIKNQPEFGINLRPNTPTNNIITSIFSKKRLKDFLKYGIAYVEKLNSNGILILQKHIMRYPQYFATKAISNALESGIKQGIIWHTQGSGKTALSYFNVKYLSDYFRQKGKVAKFFFIVDRLDLLEQASDEFIARGLSVKRVNSKEEFREAIRSTDAKDSAGENIITVVNIQKFSEDSFVIEPSYDINIQRIFFLDEAHRSYNPRGSFLANLMRTDEEAVMIALTGTPLISKDYNSRDIFGDYIHKYYYNSSIADGYTLKLIREGIQTEYKAKLESALKEIELIKGSTNKNEIFAHPKYVSPMVDYILDDYEESKIAFDDDMIGIMIVCDSSDQAREVFRELLARDYVNANGLIDNPMVAHDESTSYVADGTTEYISKSKVALILHDVDDKMIRKKEQQEFKKGNVDILVVYNMLLTGFDAPRLKKIYLGRVIKKHNLLQALTRVNRPYKNFRFGYVVDFVDIRKEFDKTNKIYFEELQNELGNEFEKYSKIFMTQKEIEQDIKEIEDSLFLFDTENLEIFSSQIGRIEKKEKLLDIKNMLQSYRELRNLIRLFGYDELMEKMTLDSVGKMFNEVTNRIAIINLKESINDSGDWTTLINTALDAIEFNFRKITEEEIVIADAFQSQLEGTRLEFTRSMDPKDPEYISLYEELKRIFKKKNLEELIAEEMKETMIELKSIQDRIKDLNNKDDMLAMKYNGDKKFLRVHKRWQELYKNMLNDRELNTILKTVKYEVDGTILKNSKVMENIPYFKSSVLPKVVSSCNEEGFKATKEQIIFFGENVANEYFSERMMA